MDKIQELNRIVDEYKNGKRYADCLYEISLIEENNFNYELLCQTFDEAINNLDASEIKKKCMACNGSGFYDNLDEDGNPIPCGACEGSGYKID